MPYPALDLTGKVAVATGSTSGLGRAIAKGLASAGAHVVASSRRDAHVNETADEIEKLAGEPCASLQTWAIADPCSTCWKPP